MENLSQPGLEAAASSTSVSGFAVYSCPEDFTRLQVGADALICECGHRFPVEQGIPVFTAHPRRESVPSNMPAITIAPDSAAIDPFVNQWIVNTNGNFYWGVRGRLPRYPIPEWPFLEGGSGLLVDLGAGWGRWSIAASWVGFTPIGIDPHLDAMQAASRVAAHLDAHANFACASAERLPFRDACVDALFSYSVLQHLEKDTARQILREAARVLKIGAPCWIQLPNRSGIRNLYLRARNGFREPRAGTFDMRYWSFAEIRAAFAAAGFSSIRIIADGFLSQNPQLADLDIVSTAGKALVPLSFAGTRIARAIPALTYLADSLWIEAQKSASPVSTDSVV
jgi:SAM-dependent methyltransferase